MKNITNLVGRATGAYGPDFLIPSPPTYIRFRLKPCQQLLGARADRLKSNTRLVSGLSPRPANQTIVIKANSQTPRSRCLSSSASSSLVLTTISLVAKLDLCHSRALPRNTSLD